MKYYGLWLQTIFRIGVAQTRHAGMNKKKLGECRFTSHKPGVIEIALSS